MDKKVYLQSFNTLREMVQYINDCQIPREDIVYIGKEEGLYRLIYFYVYTEKKEI